MIYKEDILRLCLVRLLLEPQQFLLQESRLTERWGPHQEDTGRGADNNPVYKLSSRGPAPPGLHKCDERWSFCSAHGRNCSTFEYLSLVAGYSSSHSEALIACCYQHFSILPSRQEIHKKPLPTSFAIWSTPTFPDPSRTTLNFQETGESQYQFLPMCKML